MRPWIHSLLAVLLTAAVVQAIGEEYEREPISYRTTAPKDAIADLQKRLKAGTATLKHEDKFGYLRDLLRELKVPVSSQMLVYSKTSQQRDRIEPRRPRALYFNDEVYVGYCQNGGFLEIGAVDPQLGAVFYTVDQTDADRARFIRQTDGCLVCHGASTTLNVPGFVVRSVFPDREGFPILALGTKKITQATPFADRWGGWYVTGTHGQQSHRGNLILKNEKATPEELANAAGQNVTRLDDRFATAEYLTGHSDLVALLVLEHQAEAHNHLTRANLLTRAALYDEEQLNKALKQPATNRWDSTRSRIKSVAEPLVRYLLFCEEAKLEGKVAGTSGFAEEFAKRGPRDGAGRSLRDFDLEKRLFKYPCSYLIYSPSFDALPPDAKDYVWRRLWEVLSGQEQGKEFAHLSPDDRKNILAILKATKPGLPDYWK